MMRPTRKLAFATAALIAVAGLAGAAAAEIKNSHVLTIRLPDGSQEQIRYVGDQPPEMSLQPTRWTAFASFADPLFGTRSPFAALDLISAEMDQEAAAVLQQVRNLPDALADDRIGLMQVDLSKLPPGVQGYTVVSTLSGDAVCTRTTQYRLAAPDGQPKVLTRTSGQCGSDKGPAPTPATAHASSAGAIPVRYRPNPAAVDPSLIHKVSASD